jgi:hypothetical protein
MDRRVFLQGCSAVVLAVPLAVLGDGAAAAGTPRGVGVRPRSDWARGLPVVGPLRRERPGDVRVLIVHHTASPNGYAPGDVVDLLRAFHAMHTGPERGWPDVAYNFFVDRYGAVWEGRFGSLAGPVRPDTTGGSQGFAQTCCFVGDHTVDPPTPDARRAMTLLLAGLAQRYGVRAGGTATFVSRGSNRWPAGATVTTPTIAGHRDMSLTSCPGDAAYPLVTHAFPADVAAVLAARAARSREVAETTARASTTRAAGTTAQPLSPAASAHGTSADDGVEPAAVALLAGGVVAAGATAGYLRHRGSAVRPPGPTPQVSGPT